MAENVVVITGTEPRATIDALRELDADGALELRAAAVVHRSAKGTLRLDHETGDAVAFTERHPRLGALVTLLLGPLDTLLFGNQLVALYGAREQSPEELAIGQVARAVPAGGTAVIADVVEQQENTLDAKVAGTVTRRPTADVENEIAAANQ
jgi:hypothetical protein